MNLRNKSVLITGGAGFIGSHLVDRVIREHPKNIVVVDNLFLGKQSNLQGARKAYPQLKFYQKSASDHQSMASIMRREGTEVVFNLAVIPLPASLEKPKWSFLRNVEITLNLCELARKDYFTTLVHFSSSEAYGTCEYAPMDEQHPLKPTGPYGASKAASDQLVFAYGTCFGIDAAVIRPFNNYGPRQNDRSYAGVIPITIKRILAGQPPILHGDGKQTRDYLYVTNTADAAVKICGCKAARNMVVNIASGKEVSIKAIIKFISDYMGFQQDPVHEKERQGDVRRHIANIHLAEDLIKFKPSVDLKDGLMRTIEWYRKRLV